MDSDWYISGCSKADPSRFRTAADIVRRVKRDGFLPLFSSAVHGFSVEEHTWACDWWSDDPSRDPWIWRMLIAADPEIAYGKFFDRKAGFISKDWFPVFANYRRDGYDYEGMYEDGKMKSRAKRILDSLQLNGEAVGLEMMSGELRKKAALEKGFDNIMIDLQMQTFLLISKFGRKRNRRGEEFGWHLPYFMTPETKWGAEFINSCDEKPEISWNRIRNQILKAFPAASEKDVQKMMR